MHDLVSTGLRYQRGELHVLDQRRLPGEEHWHVCEDIDDLVCLIRGLAIRGAPLIGVAAVVWIAHRAAQGDDVAALTAAIATLRASRPTAVNLMNYLDYLQAELDSGIGNEAMLDKCIAIFEEDVMLCEAMSENGAALVNDGDSILTHCNTGGLATVGVGTALGVITRAHQQGKGIRVWVDETRPLLQGGRLTAWELGKAGVPYQLICDSMAAGLMAKGEVDHVMVGSDRIAVNGDFANKIGTYSLAVLAKHHDVPFYVVAPRTTIDPDCASGDLIPIEQRDAAEVRGANGSFGDCCWAPVDAPAYNPAFDVTPAALVTGWILDSGIYDQQDVADGELAKVYSQLKGSN
ncbi:MAG: S-methyl-5-thioribose-1-phosphate isomerase [Gammaproteobacteria bacterium]|nr:S-methyl-5-thioribose-1-phosphate isomerase [Gammaproteobacteria bacterium]NNJ51374.1 S-methyl-5-thioribose-1-phosphate isomerase [Gammaproteobacteria bacterium]